MDLLVVIAIAAASFFVGYGMGDKKRPTELPHSFNCMVDKCPFSARASDEEMLNKVVGHHMQTSHGG